MGRVLEFDKILEEQGQEYIVFNMVQDGCAEGVTI